MAVRSFLVCILVYTKVIWYAYTRKKAMRKIKLNRQEKEIEDDLLSGRYVDNGKAEFEAIAEAIKARKKDSVLNIRINSFDLELLKQKAQKLGVRYQTFIGELLHRAAHN